MSSDDPIEPIHGIEPMQTNAVQGLRDRGYHVYSRYLENLLRWKRFEAAQEKLKKLKQLPPAPEEPPAPESHSDFDRMA
jgi:hypothetical protein